LTYSSACLNICSKKGLVSVAEGDQKMLTVSEVAQRLGESDRTVRNWVNQNLFPGAMLEKSPRGPYWMIPETALRSFEKPPRGRPPKRNSDGSKASKRKVKN
jgi:hypothetical protein